MAIYGDQTVMLVLSLVLGTAASGTALLLGRQHAREIRRSHWLALRPKGVVQKPDRDGDMMHHRLFEVAEGPRAGTEVVSVVGSPSQPRPKTRLRHGFVDFEDAAAHSLFAYFAVRIALALFFGAGMVGYGVAAMLALRLV